MTGFSKNFLWGAASSAYQIEGFSTADNGGVCIWDEFCKIPGKIAWADDGRTACDAYHRWQEDLTLLKELGAGAYRFSTSWARIDPNGDGCWNQAGLGYYDKIVNRCLEYGIEPFMTLYHWELPQAAEDRGGWQSRETSKAFARYAGMMAEHFKGRVKNYFTLNEPQCTVMLGYGLGHHAPGKKLDVNGQFNVHVNQLLAHGMALRAMKAADPDAQIGIASTGRLCYPAGESTEDLDAARSATFDSSDENWVFTHHFLLDPICFGHFPDTANETLRELISHVSAEDLATIHAVPDLLGYNIYNGNPVAAGSGSFRYVNREPGSPRTALKWPVSRMFFIMEYDFFSSATAYRAISRKTDSAATT